MGIVQTLTREIGYLDSMRRLIGSQRGLDREARLSVAEEFEKVVDRFPNNPAFRFEGATRTYAELDAIANRAARWAVKVGLKRGDIAALFMTNRPEYVAIWLGLAKVGVGVALINSNLLGHPLTHSIDISGAHHLILSNDLAEPYHAVEQALERRPQAWAMGGPVQGARDFDEMLAQMKPNRPAAALREGVTGGTSRF